MAILPFSARDRAAMYAHQNNLTIQDPPLGGGFDGLVLATDRGSAIKSMNNRRLYRQELDVYVYMTHKKIFTMSGFHIPKLIQHDNSNCIIEMSIVTPPYVVDFAGARLKRPEQFSEEIMDDWYKQKREEFGEDWPRVKRLLFAFESQGIFLTDVHTRNVACR